ncbi:reverse transcriptase domain-containing protein [Tanacetum coccineum]
MMASFFQMNTASTSGTGSLSSNTVANPKGELKAITTQSGLVLDGPTFPMPPPFVNPEEDQRVEETLTDPKHGEDPRHPHIPYPSRMNQEKQKEKDEVQIHKFWLHKRDPLHPNIPYPLRMHQEKQQEKDEVQIYKFWKMFKQLHINISLVDALILIPKYQKMLKSLLSNKEKLLELANTHLNENCSTVILKKLPEKLGDPGKFLIPCGFSKHKYKALADLGASINLMPLSVWKNLGLPELISTRMTLELANRTICTPAGIARDVFVSVGKFTLLADFVIVDYESDPKVPRILGRPFLWTARALNDVHREEMILRDGDERLILNMRHDTSSYSNKPKKESINMIDIYNVSHKDYLEDLFENEKATNHQCGNPTFSFHIDLTSPEVINLLSGNPTPISEPVTKSSSSPTLTSLEESELIWEEFKAYLASDSFPPGSDDNNFDPEGDLCLIEELINDPSSPVPLSHNPLSGSTTSSHHLLEEFADELALITFPPDAILEMFTNEHALDYSSPPLYDDVDDDLVELESDNDDVYDDPFDSKEDKIKESKLLIDELDPPRSSDFLPSPKCDSVFYEDFSEVDALPSTNNEDKVFNPGILIHENLFEVTIQVTPDKNVKKLSSSNASLILEDFNPFLSTKKFPGPKLYSRFHLKMRKKFSTPGFSLLKEFILLFSRNYLIGALKLSKSLKFLKARWRFFLALMERTSVFWMFRVSISIPLDQFKYGGIGSS